MAERSVNIYKKNQPRRELFAIFSLKFLEKNTVLLESCELEIDFFSSQEEREEARILMNLEIESGLSWPFEEVFPDFSSFSKYFLSHSAFVVRVRNFEVLQKSKKGILQWCWF